MCVRRRLGVLVCSLWQELAQKHICVLGLFLPSFRYNNCIAYILLTLYLLIIISFLCYFYVSLRIYIYFGNFGFVIIKIHNSRSHNITVIDIVTMW